MTEKNRNFDEFFEDYELESIKDIFIENEFTTTLALTEVSDEDLKEMGIKALGKRRQFLAAVKDLQAVGKKNTVVEKSAKDDQQLDTVENLPQKEGDDLPVLFHEKRREEPASKRKLDLNSLQDKDDKTLETPQKKTREMSSSPSLTNWLKSPLNVDKVLEAKKISLYTQAEIQKSYGLRRKKMEFMNSKIKHLIEDPSVRGQNKTTILGMAEVAWDRYNAEEAKIDEIEVHSLLSALEKKGHTYNEKQTQTIKKDSERVNHTLSDISTQLKRIQKCRDLNDLTDHEKKKKIEVYENELTEMHRELQKATDALRKACGIKIVQLQAMIQNIKEKEEEIEQLSDECSNQSDSSIVNDIKDQNEEACTD